MRPEQPKLMSTIYLFYNILIVPYPRATSGLINVPFIMGRGKKAHDRSLVAKMLGTVSFIKSPIQ